MKLPRLTLAAAAASVSFSAAAAAQQITGAGATFPAPVYAKWASAAKAAIGVTLNYQAIGSGAGQTQIINHTVDFGASDAPMAPAKLAANHLLQFPTVMGGVVPIVNIPGVAPNRLKLTGDVLAQIFSGDVTAWNDPGDHGAQPRPAAAASADRAGAPRRRLGHDLRVHLVPVGRERQVEVHGGGQHLGRLAVRRRCEGQ